MAVVSLPQVPQQDVPFSDPGSWTWNDYFVRQKQALELAFQQISGGSSVIINSGGGFLTPYDFGAFGDGVTDDTAAMQAWLNAIAGTTGYMRATNKDGLAAGQFLCGDEAFLPLIVKSNTHIIGDGPAVSQFVSGDISASTTLLTNDNRAGPGDQNIIFENVGFNGQNLTSRYPISTAIVARQSGSSGIGYAVGDTGVVDGGGGNATYEVLTETGGAVDTISITDPGTGYYTNGHVTTTAGGLQPGVGVGLCLKISADRTIEFIAMRYVAELLFRNCLFTHCTYLNLYLASTTNARFEACTFTDLGDSIDLSAAVNTRILGCTFRDNRSASISMSGGIGNPTLGTKIEANNFNNNGEVFIFSDVNTVQTVINGNTFHTSFYYWDNAVGCELAGSNISFTNNVMMYTGWNGITFFTCLGVTVTGNQFFYPGQTDDPPEPGNDPSCCVMFFIEQAGSIGRDIIVSDNLCVANTAGTVDGIRFRSYAGGTQTFNNVLVSNNQTFGSTWRTGGVVVDNFPLTSDSVWDASCRRKDNWATEDCDSFLTHVLMNAGGGLTVTGCPFRPRTASIYSTVVTPANILFCLTEVAPNLVATSNGNSGNNDLGVARFYNNTGDTPTAGFAIDLRDGTGVVVCQANISAYTQDGLIITPIIAPTSPVWLTLTLRP